jgi:MFS family permease
MYTVVSAIVSSMMAPALPHIAERFNIVNPTEVALTLSIFMLSYALSPLLNAPLSEMYGRTWVSTL